jgi:hypothetical protein
MTHNTGHVATLLRWIMAALTITLLGMLAETTMNTPNAWVIEGRAHGTVAQPDAPERPVMAELPQVETETASAPQVTALSDMLAAEDEAATTEHIYEDDPRWDCATMGNRKCGQAATVQAEDGTQVAPSFYDRTTTTGATQARCDYLGKTRVTDPTYGHRCV